MSRHFFRILLFNSFVFLDASLQIHSDNSTLTRTQEGCLNLCSCHWNQKFTEITAVCQSIPTKLDPKVTNLKVTDDVIDHLHKLIMQPLYNIKELDLSSCHVKYINRAFSKNKFRIIRLSNNKITEITNQNFGNLSSLQKLYLDNNAIRWVEDDSFRNMGNLKLLHLQNNYIKGISFFVNLPVGIKEIDLNDNEITQMPEINEVKLIQKLNLCGNNIKVLPELHKLTALQELCLEGVQFMAIRGLPTTITSLVLNADRNEHPLTFTDTIKITLENMKIMINLTIVNHYIKSFDFLQNLNKLKRLELIKIKVGNTDGAYDILKNKPNLRQLNLNQSSRLAQQLLHDCPQKLATIPFISLQRTEIPHLMHCENTLKKILIDIQENPLNCSKPNWNWIKTTDNISSLFVNATELLCEHPKEVKKMKLTDVLSGKAHIADAMNLELTSTGQSLFLNAMTIIMTTYSIYFNIFQ